MCVWNINNSIKGNRKTKFLYIPKLVSSYLFAWTLSPDTIKHPMEGNIITISKFILKGAGDMADYIIAYHVKSMHPHFALLSKYDSHNISISFYASQWYLNFEALEKLHIVLGETKFPNKTDMDIVNIITDYGMHK